MDMFHQDEDDVSGFPLTDEEPSANEEQSYHELVRSFMADGRHFLRQLELLIKVFREPFSANAMLFSQHVRTLPRQSRNPQCVILMSGRQRANLPPTPSDLSTSLPAGRGGHLQPRGGRPRGHGQDAGPAGGRRGDDGRRQPPPAGGQLLRGPGRGRLRPAPAPAPPRRAFFSRFSPTDVVFPPTRFPILPRRRSWPLTPTRRTLRTCSAPASGSTSSARSPNPARPSTCR